MEWPADWFIKWQLRLKKWVLPALYLQLAREIRAAAELELDEALKLDDDVEQRRAKFRENLKQLEEESRIAVDELKKQRRLAADEDALELEAVRLQIASHREIAEAEWRVVDAIRQDVENATTELNTLLQQPQQAAASDAEAALAEIEARMQHDLARFDELSAQLGQPPAETAHFNDDQAETEWEASNPYTERLRQLEADAETYALAGPIRADLMAINAHVARLDDAALRDAFFTLAGHMEALLGRLMPLQPHGDQPAARDRKTARRTRPRRGKAALKSVVTGKK